MSIIDGKDLTEHEDDGYDPEAVAKLNDELRRTMNRPGKNTMVVFVATLGNQMRSLDTLDRLRLQAEIVQKVQSASFDEPGEDGNNPYGERDFGTFMLGDEKCFWKIDYYDLNREYASPDPTNPDVTSRVMSIFYAEDY